jgi:hypothetical protein
MKGRRSREFHTENIHTEKKKEKTNMKTFNQIFKAAIAASAALSLTACSVRYSIQFFCIRCFFRSCAEHCHCHFPRLSAI